MLIPLSECDDLEETLRAAYPQDFIDLGTVDGVLYGFPLGAQSKGTIWYDRQFFAANGYTALTAADSFTQLLALTDQIRNAGVVPPWSIGVESGEASGWPGTDWIQQIILNEPGGVEVYDGLIDGSIPFTDPRVKAAWEKFGQIALLPANTVQGGGAGINATFFIDSVLPPFRSPSEAAMVYMGDFARNFITGEFPGLVAGTDFDFFPWPGGAVTGGANVVQAFNNDPTTCSFLEWLAGAEAQRIRVGLGGFTSVNTGVLLGDYPPDPVARAIAEQLTTTSVFRFDLDDAMSRPLGEAFWQGVVDYLAGGDLDAILAQIEAARPLPHFFVFVDGDNVGGENFLGGATVVLTIDNPLTPESPDYTATEIVGPAPWNPAETFVQFDLQGVFDIQPGQVVTLSDGITTKTHTVTNLTVTSVDPVADTVSGTAVAGSHVNVGICDEFACIGIERHEVADASGNWTANFSVVGDEEFEQNTFDLVPGTGGDAEQTDEDGDQTAFGWRVPNPAFTVDPLEDQVWGNQWPQGATATLTIDDPGTVGSLDYTETRTVLMAPWDPRDTFLLFGLKGFFDIQPGHVVTLSDGVSTKTHVVTNLTVTTVDPVADTVSGTADAFAEVHVHGGNEMGFAQRRVFADELGNWTAFFAIPGAEDFEQDILDIAPSTGGGAQEFDDDGDATQAGWGVPEPDMEPELRLDPMFGLADPQQVTASGFGWTPNADITLAQCSGGVFDLPGGPSFAGCDPATTVNVTADAAGRFTATLTVQAQLSTVEFGPIDCTEGLGACVVLAATAGFAEGSARQIGFGLPSPGPVITNPGDLLISDTGGILWTFDVGTGEITDYRLPISGNFDIQYSGPQRIVIAGFESGEIYELDLGTGAFTLVTNHPALARPLGLAVDPSGGGTYYIADHERGVLAYDVQTGTMRVLVGQFEGATDGIALGQDGRILFTNHSGRVYRISPDGTSLEVVADVGPYGLNGIVVTPDGQVIAASTFQTLAVLSIDPATGAFSTLHEGPPFRNPEDVAIGANGYVYIADTDFERNFPDFVPALYRIQAGSPTLETLHAGAPLGDIVDILITPGVVFADDVSTFVVQPDTVNDVTIQITNTDTQPHTVTGLSTISDFDTPAAAFVTPTPIAVGPGETVQVTLRIDTTGTPEGTYLGLMKLTSDATPGEDFASVEIVVSVASLPDLTTTTPTGTITITPDTPPLPPDPFEAFTISATVFNVGTAAAGPFTVNFFEGTNLLGSQSFAGLDIGGSVPTSFTVMNGLAEGFYVIHLEIVLLDGGEIFVDNNTEGTFLQAGNPPIPEAAIVVTASADVGCGGGTVYVSGLAQYEIGSGTTLFTFPVQGGRVTVTMLETGASFSGAHTQTSGFFLQGLGAPSPGTYSLRVEVTDFSLTGVVEIPLEVPAVPPPCPTPTPPGGDPGTPDPNAPPPDPGVPPEADLYLSSGDIAFLDSDCLAPLVDNPNLGAIVCIRATIHYFGTNSLFNQPVAFTAHFPAGGNTLAATQIGSTVVNFSGGGTVDVAILWEPAATGAHIIQVKVHPTISQFTGNDAATRSICPGDPITCDITKSGGGFFDASGGSLTTPDGDVQITIPEGALTSDTGISVTGSDRTGFELTTNLGQAIGVFAVDIQPSGLTFDQPITIVFSWDDADNDGFVDGFNIKEDNLLITKDNDVITGRCRDDPGCDTVANTFSVTVTSLSEFVLAAPKDSDGDDVPDDFDGVIDACPLTPGLVERQGCPVGDANLVELHVVDLAKSGECLTVTGVDSSSCKFPIEGAAIKVFDRNQLNGLTITALDGSSVTLTKNPDGSLYDDIYESSAANASALMGSCTTDASGQCIAGEEGVGDYLVIVKVGEPKPGTAAAYTGKPKGPGDFVDTNADGLGDLASKDFQIIMVIKSDGSVQISGGSKTVVTGSFLEIVYAEFAVWEDMTAGYVYPFIFTSDSDWTVDVCAQVPTGYAIVGVYDENGNLVSDANCVQTFVAGETKVVAFEVIEVGSPAPVLSTVLSVEHEGKVTQVDIEVPGVRAYVEELPAQANEPGATEASGSGGGLAPVWSLVAAALGIALLGVGIVVWRRRRA
ncbi:MAG: extracellular solute-binding protein [Nitrospinota bacterium]